MIYFFRDIFNIWHYSKLLVRHELKLIYFLLVIFEWTRKKVFHMVCSTPTRSTSHTSTPFGHHRAPPFQQLIRHHRQLALPPHQPQPPHVRSQRQPQRMETFPLLRHRRCSTLLRIPSPQRKIHADGSHLTLKTRAFLGPEKTSLITTLHITNTVC